MVKRCTRNTTAAGWTPKIQPAVDAEDAVDAKAPCQRLVLGPHGAVHLREASWRPVMRAALSP